MVNKDRVAQASIGVVLAFSLLWTVAIFCGGSSGQNLASPQQFGRVVDDERNAKAAQCEDDENVHVIHSSSPTVVKRVSSFLFSIVVLSNNSWMSNFSSRNMDVS